MMVQWLLDPDRALSGRSVAEALRTILADIGQIENIDTAGPGTLPHRRAD